MHCAIEHPTVIVVLDDTLLKTVDVCEGTDASAVIIVNTQKNRDIVHGLLSNKNAKLFTIDATGISLDELKRPIPNTPLIGALIKASNVLKPETAYHGMEKKFGHKFGAKIVEGNIRAIKRAMEEVVSE
jgi:pyruvate ferredoxin oxidoreductase gamma subunit